MFGWHHCTGISTCSFFKKTFVFLYFGYFFNCNRACASASASNYKLLLVNKPTAWVTFSS